MKESIKKIDDTNFEKITSAGCVLVDFSAEWCGPCKMLHPVLESLAIDAEVAAKVVVGKMDVDESPKTTQHFQITSVPTLIIFKNGAEVNRIVGLKDLATLKKILLQHA